MVRRRRCPTSYLELPYVGMAAVRAHVVLCARLLVTTLLPGCNAHAHAHAHAWAHDHGTWLRLRLRLGLRLGFAPQWVAQWIRFWRGTWRSWLLVPL